jgi:chromosomal replication initiator protein
VFFDEDLLKEALKILKERNEINFSDEALFTSRTEIASFDGKTLVLSVNSRYYQDKLRERLQLKLERVLSELEGLQITIIFKVSDKKNLPDNEPSALTASVPEKKKHKKEKPRALLAENTFATFVPGENSEFALGVAKSIAENPQNKQYNPCLIFGGVGLGKTHLLQAIGNQIYEQNPDANILYMTARELYEDITKSILSDNKNNEYRKKYSLIDILLIDDIHVLENKKATQETLYHIFDDLYNNSKPVVFTCDRPVTELKNITPRLLSRFAWGIKVDLQPPNFETKVAIINKKLNSLGKSLNDDVIEFIAKSIQTNVRDLEAAIKTLIAYAEITNKTITIDLARTQLRSVLQNTSSAQSSTIPISLVQKIVSSYFNVSVSDLKSKKKTQSIVMPRQLAMYIIRNITEYSTTEIGLEFGGRDHTTVMHSCDKIEKLKLSDPNLESTIQNLIRAVRENNDPI